MIKEEKQESMLKKLYFQRDEVVVIEMLVLYFIVYEIIG